MSEEHTSGNWEREGLIVVACCGRLSIAEVHDHSDTSELHTTEEAEANARLIAAAPDLLEVCKEAFDLIDLARQYFPKSIKNNAKFKLENTCATIGKAIAKTKET